MKSATNRSSQRYRAQIQGAGISKDPQGPIAVPEGSGQRQQRGTADAAALEEHQELV